MIRSHDEKELIDLVEQHAKKSHNMRVSEKDIRDKMKAAQLIFHRQFTRRAPAPGLPIKFFI